MTCVLITAVGGDVAQGVAAVIRESFPEWRLVGSDMSDRHAGELFVDEVHRAPKAGDATYLDWLRQTISREHADFCLPLSEAELDVICNHRIECLSGADMVTAGMQALSVGNDKLKTAEFLEEIGVPAPWTVASQHALADNMLPCVYKPRHGAGSKSVFICHNKKQADFYAVNFPGGIFQELLLPHDEEVTCAVYRTNSGKTAVLQLHRVLVGGLTGWARVVKDDEIDLQCQRVAEALNLSGAINIQLRRTAAGPRIFEVNARFSSTVLMRHRMGFQDVVWTLKERIGKTVTCFAPAPGTIGVRTSGVAILHAGK